MALITLVIALALTSSAFSSEQTLNGKVISIADGDTLTILVDHTQHRIRFNGIDAPERGQAFSTRAGQYAGDLVFGKTVTVNVLGKDRYGRLIGDITLPDSRNLNHEMVRAGLAWWFRKYAPADKALEHLEQEAREAKRGLWADPNPVPPWEHRRR